MCQATAEKGREKTTHTDTARERESDWERGLGTTLKAEGYRGPESLAGMFNWLRFRKQQDTLEGRRTSPGTETSHTDTQTPWNRIQELQQKKRKAEGAVATTEGGIEAVACFKLEYQNNLSAQ